MAKKDWELAELVAFMQSNRVTRVKMGGLEVDLSPTAFSAPEPIKSDELSADPTAPSEDELMRWSVPGAFMEADDVVKAGQ